MSSFGFLAAVAAPFVMTVGFIFWDNHWRGGSTFALNLFKCNAAAVGFLIASAAARGGSFPTEIVTLENVGFLLLSSAIGIIVGDLLWLEGLRLLGARRVIVVDAVKPFLSALMGWAILGETLRYPAFLGMALTVAGVLVVSLEQTVATAKDGDMPSITTVTATTGSQHGISDEQAHHEPVDDGADETKQCELSATGDVETSSTKNGRPDGDNSGKSNQQPPSPRLVAVATTTPQQQDTTPTNNEQQPKRQQGSMRENRTNNNTISLQRRGYVMAVLNVVLDTYGSVLTKQYGVGMTTWEISLIRFGFAGIVMLVISVAVAPFVDSVVRRKRQRKQSNNEVSNTNIMSPPPGVVDQQDSTDTTDPIQSTPPWYALPAARDMSRRSWAHVMAGVALVTFLTPALSNYALFQVALALALTLGSVGPLYALPLSWWLQGDRPTVRACWGAAMAVAGVAVLSLFGNSSTV